MTIIYDKNTTNPPTLNHILPGFLVVFMAQGKWQKTRGNWPQGQLKVAASCPSPSIPTLPNLVVKTIEITGSAKQTVPLFDLRS